MVLGIVANIIYWIVVPTLRNTGLYLIESLLAVYFLTMVGLLFGIIGFKNQFKYGENISFKVRFYNRSLYSIMGLTLCSILLHFILAKILFPFLFGLFLFTYFLFIPILIYYSLYKSIWLIKHINYNFKLIGAFRIGFIGYIIFLLGFIFVFETIIFIVVTVVGFCIILIAAKQHFFYDFVINEIILFFDRKKFLIFFLS